MGFKLKKIIISCVTVVLFSSCQDNKKNLNYKQLLKDIFGKKNNTITLSDTANLIDNDNFDPEKIADMQQYLDSIAPMMEKDSLQLEKSKTIDSTLLKNDAALIDTNISNPDNVFSNKIKNVNQDEIKALKYNLKQLQSADSILKATALSENKQLDARVWARISKTNQRLYLYIDGEIVDTFKVSTGTKGHETPLLDQRPSGPSFQKYTSKKYPGGNYNGLGNMPYVVFIKGGYGIHGTTLGNIPKLGKKASHGCIRVHPDNAKIFFELVRKAELENVWITIEE